MKLSIFILPFLLLSCSTPQSKTYSFYESYFHKYGVLKFDLRSGTFPEIKFYEEGKPSEALFELNSKGFFKGSDQICALTDKLVLKSSKSQFEPVCNEGHPFTSGFSERTNAPYLEVEFDSIDSKGYSLNLFDKAVKFDFPKTPVNKYEIFKTQIFVGEELKNSELRDVYSYKSLIQSGFIIPTNMEFPEIEFFSNPELSGDPLLKISDMGVFQKTHLMCKVIKTDLGERLLKESDHSFDDYSVDVCKNGLPFVSAFSNKTSKSLFIVWAKPISLEHRVYEVSLPDNQKAYFKGPLTLSSYFERDSSYLEKITKNVLLNNPALQKFYDDLQACIKKKNIDCLLDKIHPSYEKQAIQALRSMSNEYFLLERKSELPPQFDNLEKPRKVKSSHPILKKYKLDYVFWPSVKFAFEIRLNRCFLNFAYSDLGKPFILLDTDDSSLGRNYRFHISYVLDNQKPNLIIEPELDVLSEHKDDPDWENLDLDISDIENSSN